MPGRMPARPDVLNDSFTSSEVLNESFKTFGWAERDEPDTTKAASPTRGKRPS